ncbi:MAG: N-acetyltransferase [Actinomycetes bacterium]
MTEEATPDIDESADPRPAHGGPFVSADFAAPLPPRTQNLWLEPLGVEHNEADYAAWTSSVEHIHATPGFETKRWPHPMTLEENAGDLRQHADHFARGLGFTYTVRSRVDDDVVGCVYIYPSKDPASDASVRSWVRATHAPLDAELWRTITDWLAADWPFTHVDYAPR